MSLLPKIALGTQGLKVTALGYGCMGLTSYYGPKLEDADIVTMLEKVYANGVNFWDTAYVYSYHDPSRQNPIVCQEEKIAPALHKIGRDNIVIATKTGIDILQMAPQRKVQIRGDPEFIRQQCEGSLQRLQVDCLDLFYLHRIDENVPIERSMMELKKLVEEGKIKYIGLSECSSATLRRAHKVHPISCIQMEYSLWCRGIEEDILPTCKELGVGLVAYSPLGRGFFGGAYSKELQDGDFRKLDERFKEEENIKMFDKVEEIAKKKNVTPAQLALAWVQAQQHRAAGVVPIPGTTKEANLLSNVGSAKIDLSAEDLATLEAAVTEAKGPRYPGGPTSKTWETESNIALSPDEAKELGLA